VGPFFFPKKSLPSSKDLLKEHTHTLLNSHKLIVLGILENFEKICLLCQKSGRNSQAH
jgi:hypothetical protein